MRTEVLAAGKFSHRMLKRLDDRIQIITIAEILDGKRMDLPMGRTDTVKEAEEAEDDERQQTLL